MTFSPWRFIELSPFASAERGVRNGGPVLLPRRKVLVRRRVCAPGSPFRTGATHVMGARLVGIGKRCRQPAPMPGHRSDAACRRRGREQNPHYVGVEILAHMDLLCVAFTSACGRPRLWRPPTFAHHATSADRGCEYRYSSQLIATAE